MNIGVAVRMELGVSAGSDKKNEDDGHDSVISGLHVFFMHAVYVKTSRT